VAVLGGKKERPAGAVVGVGAAAGDAMLGTGYQFTMTFRCEK
jgi:hypothetical protein